MGYKWIGAVLIISACGGYGFSLGSVHRREERLLRSLIRGLEFMISELHFHATQLPELCQIAGKECGGEVGQVLCVLADALDRQASSDVCHCMNLALEASQLPPLTYQNLQLLGASLGRFDLEGQLKGLEAVREASRKDLEALTANREVRLRNYQTLSLCAGAALAIVLI